MCETGTKTVGLSGKDTCDVLHSADAENQIHITTVTGSKGT